VLDSILVDLFLFQQFVSDFFFYCYYCSALFFPSLGFIPLDFSSKVFNEVETIHVLYLRFWSNPPKFVSSSLFVLSNKIYKVLQFICDRLGMST
jgi:hypothetical protein